MSFYREKSDYFRKELLSTLLFEKCQIELKQIRKERFYSTSRRDRIKKRAEELWQNNSSNSDLDNWLQAEKEIMNEERNKNQRIIKTQAIITRCIIKFYNKNILE